MSYRIGDFHMEKYLEGVGDRQKHLREFLKFVQRSKRNESEEEINQIVEQWIVLQDGKEKVDRMTKEFFGRG